MLDTRFINFCRADSLFYDAAAAESVGADFHEGRTLPEGWTTTRGREWTVCLPPDCHTPDQGWKIHVAASPGNAAELLDAVAPYCVEHGLMFKYISDEETLSRRGSKYGDRSASGKFITVYPEDETVLKETLDALDALVGGTPAPSVLSDLRWKEGPLYVRYGGFVLKTARLKDGSLVPAITAPNGELVPDERRPGFRPPAWVTLPSFLDEAVAERRARTLTDFPFRVYKALHFSNGGGVYRAVDKRDGTELLLKEARPLAGLDAAGEDAVTRLEREHWALSQLSGLAAVPVLRDVRKGSEHLFLARDYVDGTPSRISYASATPTEPPTTRPTPGRSTRPGRCTSSARSPTAWPPCTSAVSSSATCTRATSWSAPTTPSPSSTWRPPPPPRRCARRPWVPSASGPPTTSGAPTSTCSRSTCSG